MHSQNGTVTSPNWPQNYADNTECVWEVNVQSGYFIEAIFNATFALQTDCNDYVEVRLQRFIHRELSKKGDLKHSGGRLRERHMGVARSFLWQPCARRTAHSTQQDARQISLRHHTDVFRLRTSLRSRCVARALLV